LLHDQTTHFMAINYALVLQCFDAVGWVARRASGL